MEPEWSKCYVTDGRMDGRMDRETCQLKYYIRCIIEIARVRYCSLRIMYQNTEEEGAHFLYQITIDEANGL